MRPGSGAVLEQDREATLAPHEKPVDLRKILAGEIKTPALAKDFEAAIEATTNAAMGR